MAGMEMNWFNRTMNDVQIPVKCNVVEEQVFFFSEMGYFEMKM